MFFRESTNRCGYICVAVTRPTDNATGGLKSVHMLHQGGKYSPLIIADDTSGSRIEELVQQSEEGTSDNSITSLDNDDSGDEIQK